LPAFVNNLGIFEPKRFGQITDDHWRRFFEVNVLSGGKPFAEFEKEFFASVRPSSLIKRFATTEEVANLVVYVCSPLSSATNGAALRVDGGVVRACF
jgi:NAD(P)-dependent dehydrogenase (short-subunit alcohol dehydrogenase family)